MQSCSALRMLSNANRKNRLSRWVEFTNCILEQKKWAFLSAWGAPDSSTKWLLWIKDWNFNWQGDYAFKQSVFLPMGKEIMLNNSFFFKIVDDF